MNDFGFVPDSSTLYSKLEKQYGLPNGTLTSMQKVESGGNDKAVSSAGARGRFQFMPATAKQYGVDTNDMESSATGAAKYMADLMKQYGGNSKAALAAYNGGGANAQYQVDGTPPPTTKVSAQNFKTNQNYVKNVSDGQFDFVPDEPKAPAAPTASASKAVLAAAPTTSDPSFFDSAATAIRGFGQGATAGLVQYPQALAMKVTRSLDGSAKGMDNSFTANLADLRGQNAQLADQQPVAFYGGQIVGGGVLGAATGGTSLAGLAGAGAVQGATSAYTASKDAGLVDAGIGGTLGALGGTVGKAAGATKNFVASRIGAKMAPEARAAAESQFGQAADAMRGGTQGLEKATDNTLMAQAQNVVRKGTEEGVDWSKPATLAPEYKQAYDLINGRIAIGRASQLLYPDTLPKAFANQANGSFNDLLGVIPGVVKGSVGGAGVGATAAAITGNDPITGAKLGALYGPGRFIAGSPAGPAAILSTAAKDYVKDRSLQALVSPVTGTVASMFPGAATQAVVAGANSPTMSYDDYVTAYASAPDDDTRNLLTQQYQAQQNGDAGARLKQLADSVRSSM